MQTFPCYRSGEPAQPHLCTTNSTRLGFPSFGEIAALELSIKACKLLHALPAPSWACFPKSQNPPVPRPTSAISRRGDRRAEPDGPVWLMLGQKLVLCGSDVETRLDYDVACRSPQWPIFLIFVWVRIMDWIRKELVGRSYILSE